MYCANCGTDTSDSQFCRKCGQRVAVAVSGGAAAAPALAPAPKRKLVRTPLLIAGILVLGLLALMIVEGTTRSAHYQSFDNDSLVVKNLNYHAVTFNVPAGATNAIFTGDFNVQSGFGKDVEVFLFSPDDFVNWQNGHQSRTYYSSGKVTVGKFNVPLTEAGQYIFVINNRFSLLTDKSLQVHVRLSYYQ